MACTSLRAMEEPLEQEAPRISPDETGNRSPDEDRVAAPLTKFRCPVHAVPEERNVVPQGGEWMIRYSCPVEGCGHTWTVKRLRA